MSWDHADRDALLAALAWQVELGADEAVGEAPVDRFAESAAARPPAQAEPPAAAPAPAAPRPGRGAAPSRPAPAARAADSATDAAAAARDIAAACHDLPSLAAALAAFDGCALKLGARSCVFADGFPSARVMVVGEAPGREEDLAGKPFVGRSGQLLDRMLAEIGLDRRRDDPDSGAYITNVVPWRPVENRTPSADEIALLAPFALRHVELADPDFLLLAGASAARALLGTTDGVLRLRGRWRRGPGGRPCLPTLHPAYLLRAPAQKRLAWRDLLALRAALDGAPVAFD
jgi:DNA polymerase